MVTDGGEEIGWPGEQRSAQEVLYLVDEVW